MTSERQQVHHVRFTHFHDFAGGYSLISMVQRVGGQHTDFETCVLLGD